MLCSLKLSNMLKTLLFFKLNVLLLKLICTVCAFLLVESIVIFYTFYTALDVYLLLFYVNTSLSL